MNPSSFQKTCAYFCQFSTRKRASHAFLLHAFVQCHDVNCFPLDQIQMMNTHCGPLWIFDFFPMWISARHNSFVSRQTDNWFYSFRTMQTHNLRSLFKWLFRHEGCHTWTCKILFEGDITFNHDWNYTVRHAVDVCADELFLMHWIRVSKLSVQRRSKTDFSLYYDWKLTLLHIVDRVPLQTLARILDIYDVCAVRILFFCSSVLTRTLKDVQFLFLQHLYLPRLCKGILRFAVRAAHDDVFLWVMKKFKLRSVSQQTLHYAMSDFTMKRNGDSLFESMLFSPPSGRQLVRLAKFLGYTRVTKSLHLLYVPRLGNSWPTNIVNFRLYVSQLHALHDLYHDKFNWHALCVHDQLGCVLHMLLFQEGQWMPGEWTECVHAIVKFWQEILGPLYVRVKKPRQRTYMSHTLTRDEIPDPQIYEVYVGKLNTVDINTSGAVTLSTTQWNTLCRTAAKPGRLPIVKKWFATNVIRVVDKLCVSCV